ncbi:Gamma-aminobutyric acid (GABA) B receptor [Seminavis robusta]|uniref:Gamma-aminobutyric acid (GABA) B receptor n=1 Tax=Seminavis robusta TaxID=568900 RepID=A0A9N8F0X9_9STRA|nr:Gamma-aminobutyric acid (GABA) B receptor [Seminavis robusta]|eukprot:Sro2528_g330390.1 Gamma-aminobutyric acid (GABA) B receptor (497) ;mRNA; r:12344-13834
MLDESDSEYIRFDSRLAVLLAHGQVQEMHDFRYYGNTTAMPSALPTVHDHNYNLIPVGAQAFGWFLSAALMTMSLGWIVWVQQHQTAVIVQASQPVFLYQVCVGTWLMAAAIIHMGFQGTEPTMGLNTACMFIPWLVFVGFVVSLSALFSKAWRLNQIVKSGVQMRRVQVQVVDVIWPFVLLMTINVTLLTAWTIVAPLEYIRENDPHNVDMFGRHVESFGACKVNPDNSVSPLWFQIPIFLVNVATLGIATYQSYKSRHLPTEFSESSYLAISMASLLESLLLGGPILFVTLDNPTAFFVVGSGLLAVCCLCILLPVFIPKFQKRNEASLATTLRDSIVSASMRKMSSARGGLDSSLRSSHGFNATSSSNFSREFQQHPHQYSPPPSHGTRSAPVSADSWNVTTSQFSDDAQSHDSDIDISDTPKKREPWGRMSIKRTASDKPVTATSNGSSEKNRTSSNQSNRGSRAPSTLVSRSQCSSMPEIMEEDEIRDDNV